MKQIYEKWIKTQSKINQKWIKNRSKIARNRGLEASWRRLGGVLGRLEASGRRLGVVLEASWSRLGDVLERLGLSWGVMWASWERLGGILCLIFKPKWIEFRYAILDVIFQSIFYGFRLQKSMPEF